MRFETLLDRTEFYPKPDEQFELPYLHKYREVTDGYSQLGRFSIYQKGAPPPFKMTAAFQRYEAAHKDDPEALSLDINGGIGNPIQTPEALKRRKRVLDGKDSHFDLPDNVQVVYDVLADWVDTSLVNHSSRYSKQGGDVETFDNVLESLGNGHVTDKKRMTLLTGGVNRTLTRIAEFAHQTAFRNVRTLDTRGNADGFGSALTSLETATDNDNYLVVLDDEKAGQQLDPDLLEKLKKITTGGKVLLVNVVDQGLSSKSIALDQDIGKFVITVDASRKAQITGVVGILGDKNAISWIQDRATALHGTPSTSEQDFRILISDICKNEALLRQILALTSEEIAAMPISFMRNMTQLLQASVRYVSSDRPHGLLKKYTGFVNEKANELENALVAFNDHEFSKNPYPRSKVVVTNGGAREGISTSLIDLRDNEGITAVLTPTADWPYKDLDIPGLDILYIDDAFTPDGMKKDRILEAIRELNKKGIKYALSGLPSGPHNPSGIIVERDDVREILSEVAQNPNAWVVADDTYLHEEFEETDEYTVAQVGADLNFDKIVSIAADTKDWGLPGNRKVSIMSRRYDVIDRIRNQRQSGEFDLNAVAVLYQLALVKNPKEAKAIINHIRVEAKQRYDLWTRVMDELGIPHTTSRGGLYICFPNPALLNSDPHQKAIEIAEEHGVSFLTVFKDMDGGEAWKTEEGVYSRIAYAGMRAESWENYERRVRNSFKVLRQVTESEGRTWPFSPLLKVST